MKKYLDLSGLKLDSDGRVKTESEEIATLSDEATEAISGGIEGGELWDQAQSNYIYCSGGSNDIHCHNSTWCNESSNAKWCSNAQCKETTNPETCGNTGNCEGAKKG